MKILKILFLNFFIFFLTIALIELIFGYWFDEDNLGPYMREYRMKKVQYSMKYKNNFYDYVYKRNYHGFRGDEIKLEEIKAVLIGGSTADERYKPENLTITGFLNRKLKKDKIEIEIINAGIEGQSTFGHIYNFKDWFPRLKGFSPKYFIFYVGINDSKNFTEENKKKPVGDIDNNSKLENFRDNLKSRSIFYDLIRKTKHKYYSNTKKKIVYDFDVGIKNYYKGQDYNFLKFDEALKFYNLNALLKKHEKPIAQYINNIDILAENSKIFGAVPIFINQLTHEGNSSERLFALNYSLINYCKKKNYSCIDLSKRLIGEKDFWWDGLHTTAKGSKVISEIIYPQLKEFMIKN